MKTRVSTFTNMFFSLTFCLGLASCNKEDFYEKEFLENPFQDPTTTGMVNGGGQGGVDSGTDVGGTQGGVDSGVDGGTPGGTTGSSPGETDGGVDGGLTTGGVEGGTVGGTDGGIDGGLTTGGVDGGLTTGGVDGGTVGGTDGGVDGGLTTGGSTGGSIDCNQGHGNDDDGVDESNPTINLDPRCKKDVFRQANAQTKKLDIVWIIDNSGSMSDEQTALGSNFSAFINEFITKDVDFKMAITTTDTSSSSRKGLMVSGSDTKLTSARAKSNETQFKSDFRNLVKVGTRGSGYEKGLEASEGFMSRYAQSFLRPEAYLAVVILSDEEDQSGKTVKNYTDNLKTYKNEEGLVKVYSIVDVNLSNNGSGVSTGYKRYADASSHTAGIVADIRDDFHRSLSAMGDSIINLLDSFALSSQPVDGTIKVYVNGVQSADYTYDSISRSIKFNPNNLPPVGAEVIVTYVKQ